MRLKNKETKPTTILSVDNNYVEIKEGNVLQLRGHFNNSNQIVLDFLANYDELKKWRDYLDYRFHVNIIWSWE